jgi:NtrC-family two-component system response regulator AlgB
MHVLLIDDDTNLRKSLCLALDALGHHVSEARDRGQAEQQLAHRMFDVALLDLRLNQESGLEILPELLRMAPGLAVIVITAYATIETAVEAMRRGAYDFLPKPFTPEQLRRVLDRVGRLRRLESHVEELEEQVRGTIPEADLQTEEPAMRLALEVAFKAAASDVTVLLRGESGTGKGVLARAIHAQSARPGGPFVTVHCPSLSGELLESELFGHARGAFTGAVSETRGKVAAAESGTLFLDEIGELPMAVQPKLLRLVQEKCYERVGESRTIYCDIRLVAATNRDLQSAIAAGRFREDLFYRLNVIEVVLPPLRERRQDLMPMAEHLLAFFARQSGKTILDFSDEARAAMLHHSWPGNIRELRNAIERAVILTSGSTIGLADLPSPIGSAALARNVEVGGRVDLELLEAEHIRRVLASTPTMEEAAAILGIDPSTLYRKRKRYGL